MPVRVGINGFGRIGRQSLKALIERTPDVEVVAVNDLVDAEMNALLFKHDSTYGQYDGSVEARDGAIAIDGREIRITGSRSALLRTLAASPTAGSEVPSFVLKWRPLRDSNPCYRRERAVSCTE